MIIIDIDDVPKSCDVCPFMRTNDDLMSDDYRYMYCGFPYMGEFVSDYIACRHPNCPIKCDIEDIKADMHNSKLWKGFSKYPNARKHDVGLDRYYDMGLDKALNIIDTNVNSGDTDDSN